MAITNKKINLVQLDEELGSQGLIADFNDPENKIIKAADNANYTEAQIEAAIEAHIAGPTQQEIYALNREQGIEKMRELGFTEDQITALIS
jgi:transcriptional regulator of heat shock response